jgi:hypothetical protein
MTAPTIETIRESLTRHLGPEPGLVEAIRVHTKSRLPCNPLYRQGSKSWKVYSLYAPDAKWEDSAIPYIRHALGKVRAELSLPPADKIDGVSFTICTDHREWRR